MVCEALIAVEVLRDCRTWRGLLKCRWSPFSTLRSERCYPLKPRTH